MSGPYFQSIAKSQSGDDVDAQIKKLITEKQERVAKSGAPFLSESDAMQQVFKENPELYEKFRKNSFNF